MTQDYKSTVFLPKTDFPMRAGLPKQEPEHLARWEEMGIWRRLREQSEGREKWILHDGPPYANGALHMGHALNKILKDVINRCQQMLGYDANYVPGWDCHGLPIEWEVEKQYRAAGKDKDEVPIVEFRRECREFAETWIEIQSEGFKRLGVFGDWERPYTTMSFDAEAAIVRELGKFLADGSLYRGARPVLWSVVERTSLAEAELEYHEHTSKTVWVRFPVAASPREELAGAAVAIWTTTPWTLPGNRAIAYGEDVEYALVEVTELKTQDVTKGQRGFGRIGERFVVARALLPQVAAAGYINEWRELATFSGAELAGTVCAHPLRGQGYDFDVPLHPGDFVSDEEGTGFVHIAPGHGADDWLLGRQHGIEVPQTVGEDGRFYDHVPLFAGEHVLTHEGKEGGANEAVIAAIRDAGGLLARGTLRHQYPHSWRSRAPLIFRNTSQWFISMDATGLRDKALKAIEETRFVPASGQARLHGMIAERPDWNVSRQRAWGVPLPIFVHKETGEPLRDPAVIERVAQAFEAEGGDAWFGSPASRFLGQDHDPDDYEQVHDVIEVWFDSGSTHAFVLEARDDLKWPASLYLEGSDQHRGWFHSSLLEAVATRGRAPYESVLTHGFLMAEDGRKMSKSLGNALDPMEVVEQYGADILRLWVVGSDYTQDLRVGPGIIQRQTDIYRRLRNTLRYILGNLAGFEPSERVEPEDMPQLERWVLHRLAELDAHIRRCCRDYEFHDLYQAVHNFCAIELSAFYFDIRKDVLYCDPADGLRRRAARTVLDRLFDCLTAWLAPVLCFTAEEAWRARGMTEPESVHLRTFPEVPAEWRDDALGEQWAKVRHVRRAVTGALEVERAEKRLGASLEAKVVVYTDPAHRAAFDDMDPADVFITSAAEFAEGEPPAGAFTTEEARGVAVVVEAAAGTKCARWPEILPDVGSHADHPEICGRCADAVTRFGAAA